jgi:hypothetical protein
LARPLRFLPFTLGAAELTLGFKNLCVITGPQYQNTMWMQFVGSMGISRGFFIDNILQFLITPVRGPNPGGESQLPADPSP